MTMPASQYVVTPAPVVSLPVSDSPQRFPVGRVLCIGRNYPWPGAPAERSSEPPFFMKPASSVVEAQGEIAYPPATHSFCHEVELVVAIGTPGADIAAGQALDHVWGYGVGLDLTRRDLQLKAKSAGMSWEAAKVFDGAAPISALTPVARIGHPQRGAIWLNVNGQQRQCGDLDQQLWSVAELIAHLSCLMPLRVGDLIMTGTPPGVAELQPGDRVEAGIDGIAQVHICVANRP